MYILYIRKKNQTASRVLKNYVGPQLPLVSHFPAAVYLYISPIYINYIHAIAIFMISWPSASILNNNKNTSFAFLYILLKVCISLYFTRAESNALENDFCERDAKKPYEKKKIEQKNIIRYSRGLVDLCIAFRRRVHGLPAVYHRCNIARTA